uniref:Uncharacterized protein n=1 Tax=Chromera velia CCMP2878 TaxID=1169474 RepID=A0A0G4H646_9ALVE|mmetsp:Transcript_32266/g.64044  ORF Transcript_32266/g.64044 Transcript_32266/m.64044 type:complete len:237 (-) Transcript_32266:191-901(-)|eukprot:Cvel_24762.t1-p1 / transcript=Cvel_24762.t1 / gene=Cvel_24762 / organism=Chromera_velia_CCMP2878 / gene_product=hypothetical protein / transcript_product=hypothetical protein / location=Cvel_scaffold2722:4864-5571(-) / protein_length=236 / sequence_SO=supercontig / SO=protein_coding / is_pseudo=false
MSYGGVPKPRVEDEFAKRDGMGLDKNPKMKTEKEARTFYFKMISTLVVCVAPLFGYFMYLAFRFVPGQAEKIDKKFLFIREYDLGWVFVAVFMIFLTRAYLIINANGARAAARVDRPDQHIYRIMSPEKPFCDAPYVLMANTGEAGRFNRAQRAVYNFDESVPTFIVFQMMVAAIFGPLALLIGLLHMYGRFTFANLYKQDKDSRSSGFGISVLAEYFALGLTTVCMLKAFLPALP